MHTRVIVSVMHPRYGFAKETVDRGARFRDEEDIARVRDEVIAQLRGKHGKDSIIVTDTREC